MKPKVGDLVRLKPIRIVRVETDHVICYGGESFGFDAIEEILPRPIAVGDRVSFLASRSDCPSSVRGKILAVQQTTRGTYAWVERDDGVFATLHETALTRIDDA